MSENPIKFCNICGCDTERGARDSCKPCNRRKSAAHRASRTPEQKAETKAYLAAYRVANEEPLKAKQKIYYANTKDERLAYLETVKESRKEKRKAKRAIDGAKKSDAYYWNNREAISAKRSANYVENREELRRINTEKYYARTEGKVTRNCKTEEESKERHKATRRAYRKKKPYIFNYTRSMRNKQQKLATPKWANKKAIREMYRISSQRTKSTGVSHEVDHMVPIKSPYVCGLHTEANLDVLTEVANQTKGNRWWPDMWGINLETPRYEKLKETPTRQPRNLLNCPTN